MIVPLPSKVVPSAGAFQIASELAIAAAPEACSVAAYLAAEWEKRTGWYPDNGEAGALSLLLHPTAASGGDESYELEVTPRSVAIRAPKPAGLFYGAQTLLQLLDLEIAAGHGCVLPCVSIKDSPRYPWRGFMLDSSRHFHTPDTIRRILDQMAYLKLNVLHWHLIDDQGWRIEIKRYPKLTEFGSRRHADEPGGSGFYTQNELRDIIAYAKERRITVMPEIEMPAHSSAAMACYPELTCSGEHVAAGAMGIRRFVAPSGEGAIFCAAREETYEFIDGVLEEVIDVFDSPVIHLGGDERPDGIWAKCPRCKALMEEKGYKSEMELQAHFMRRATQYVNKRGRRTMAWCTTTEFGIPANQIAEDWFYGNLATVAKMGHDGINASDRFTYLDYPNFPGRQKPDWMPDLSPDHMYEFNPTPEGLTEDEEKHVLGGTASLWTEFIEDDDLSDAMFPRLLAFAEVVWTPRDRRRWPDFAERMKSLEAPLAWFGLRYARPVGETPVRLARPAVVTTSMEADPVYPPERAFDGKYVRSFMSKEPPKAGDHLTVTLNEPARLDRMILYTGTDVIRGLELEDGALEISSDGESFRKVAKVNGQRTVVNLPGETVQAVRVRVEKDMEHRLAITEIVLR
jgi:hexosaminidase